MCGVECVCVCGPGGGEECVWCVCVCVLSSCAVLINVLIVCSSQLLLLTLVHHSK